MTGFYNLSTDSSTTVNRSALAELQMGQMGYFVSLAVNLMMILVGNITLLIFICTRSKSRMHLFILNLAVADLCVGFFVVLPQFVERLLMEWNGPEILCKLKWFLQTMIAYSASYALVALSIDRVDAIANPMKTSTKKSTLQTVTLISSNWILSALCAIPLWFFTRVQNHPQYGRQCSLWFGSQSNSTAPNIYMWKVYFTVNTIAVIVIPVIIVALCHVSLVLVIFKASRSPLVNGTSPNHKSKDKRDSNAGGRRCITKAKVKTVQITFTIVTTFIICWSPFTIGNFLEMYSVLDMNRHARILIQTLGTLNSAVNPLIFFLFNYKLCKADARSRQARTLRFQKDNSKGRSAHALTPRNSNVGQQIELHSVLKNGGLRLSTMTNKTGLLVPTDGQDDWSRKSSVSTLQDCSEIGCLVETSENEVTNHAADDDNESCNVQAQITPTELALLTEPANGTTA